MRNSNANIPVKSNMDHYEIQNPASLCIPSNTALRRRAQFCAKYRALYRHGHGRIRLGRDARRAYRVVSVFRITKRRSSCADICAWREFSKAARYIGDSGISGRVCVVCSLRYFV